VTEPRLTVAIPTFNGRRHLAEAVRSILAQAEAPFELLVCDDRSDDGTPDLVRSLAGDTARVELNPERLGLAGNWNRCVELSTTPLVAVFHQDDVMSPGHLAAHLARFAAPDGEALGFVCGAADVIDSTGQPVAPDVVEPGGLGPLDRTFAAGELLPELSACNPLRCSTVTLRAEAHRAAGGFDPSFRYVVDWDAWIRIACRYPVAWLGRPTVSVRWHSGSETHRFKASTADLDETLTLLERIATGDRSTSPPKIPPAARRRLARAYLNRAYDASHAGAGGLGRRCVRQALTLNPALAATILVDPRLSFRMLKLAFDRGDRASVDNPFKSNSTDT
jgi:glycosyltransferase involved in cell wall biosynthesis